MKRMFVVYCFFVMAVVSPFCVYGQAYWQNNADDNDMANSTNWSTAFDLSGTYDPDGLGGWVGFDNYVYIRPQLVVNPPAQLILQDDKFALNNSNFYFILGNTGPGDILVQMIENATETTKLHVNQGGMYMSQGSAYTGNTTFVLDGGILTLNSGTGDLVMGNSTPGVQTFTMNGGTATVGGLLRAQPYANTAAAGAVLNVNGGSMTVGNYIGGNARYNTAGPNSLDINMNGGSLTVGDGIGDYTIFPDGLTNLTMTGGALQAKAIGAVTGIAQYGALSNIDWSGGTITLVPTANGVNVINAVNTINVTAGTEKSLVLSAPGTIGAVVGNLNLQDTLHTESQISGQPWVLSAVSGSGGLVVREGITQLNGVYDGGAITVEDGGTLRFGAAVRLADATPVDVEVQTGGEMSLGNTYNQYIDALTGGGTVTINNAHLKTGNGGSTANFVGSFDTTLDTTAERIYVAPSSTLELSGDNTTFAGWMILQGPSTVKTSNPDALGSTATITVQGGSSLDLNGTQLSDVTNGAANQVHLSTADAGVYNNSAGTSASINRRIAAANVQTRLGGDGDLHLLGEYIGFGSARTLKEGDGKLVVKDSDTYFGNLDVYAGAVEMDATTVTVGYGMYGRGLAPDVSTIRVKSGVVESPFLADQVSLDGQTVFEMQGGELRAQSVGGILPANAGWSLLERIDWTGGDIVLSPAAAGGEFSSSDTNVLPGGSKTLVFDGAENLTVRGLDLQAPLTMENQTADKAFVVTQVNGDDNGTLTIADGIVQLQDQTYGAGDITIGNGATLRFGGTSALTATNPVSVDVENGGLFTTTFTGRHQVVDALNGTGTVELPGANVTVGAGGTEGDFGGTLGGSGSFIVASGATANVSGDSTGLSGDFQVQSNGTLRVGGANALGDLASVLVQQDARLDLNGEALNDSWDGDNNQVVLQYDGAGLVNENVASVASTSRQVRQSGSASSAFIGGVGGLELLGNSVFGSLTKTGTGVTTFSMPSATAFGIKMVEGELVLNTLTTMTVSSVISGRSTVSGTTPTVTMSYGLLQTDAIADVATEAGGLALNLFDGRIEARSIGSVPGNSDYGALDSLTWTSGTLAILSQDATEMVRAARPIDVLPGGTKTLELPYENPANVAVSGLNLEDTLTVDNKTTGSTVVFYQAISGPEGLYLSDGISQFQDQYTAGAITIADGAQLKFGDANRLTAASPTTVTVTDSGLLNIAGRTQYLAALDGNGQVQIDKISGAGDLFVGYGQNTSEFGGAFVSDGVNTGDGSLIVAGGGMVTLSGDNTAFLGDFVVSSGTLRAGSPNAFGDNSAIAVQTDSVLDLNGQALNDSDQGNTNWVALQSANAALVNNHQTSSATVNRAVYRAVGASGASVGGIGDIHLAGDIRGAGDITVVGDGGVYLEGDDQDYPGSFIVAGGHLYVNNDATTASAVTVATDGLLGGSGVLPATTVAGVHAPGVGVGTQTVADGITYENDAIIEFELVDQSVSAGSIDQVNAQGGTVEFDPGCVLRLVLNGPGSTVDFSDAFWTSDQEWKIVDTEGEATITGLPDSVEVTMDSQGAEAMSNREFQVELRADGDMYLVWGANPAAVDSAIWQLMR